MTVCLATRYIKLTNMVAAVSHSVAFFIAFLAQIFFQFNIHYVNVVAKAKLELIIRIMTSYPGSDKYLYSNFVLYVL